MSAVIPGTLLLAAGLVIALYLVLAPGEVRIARNRRRPGTAPTEGAVTRAADTATGLIGRVLAGRGAPGASALEQAGVRMRLQDVVFLVIVASLVGAALGAIVSGLLLAVALALLTPIGFRAWLGIRAGRRRAAFADQLDESLQLMAGSLRAGHSLLQALASVSRESEEPSREEFSRIINETRVGRPLADALAETAARMGSQDFVWVTQAIAINREVGGNLADVLDGVGHTIRERGQIRRQVKALAAEGKLSAYVLMALPIGIVAFLSISNPAYLEMFHTTLIGWGLIALCVILLGVGALWMRKVVSIRF